MTMVTTPETLQALHQSSIPNTLCSSEDIIITLWKFPTRLDLPLYHTNIPCLNLNSGALGNGPSLPGLPNLQVLLGGQGKCHAWCASSQRWWVWNYWGMWWGCDWDLSIVGASKTWRQRQIFKRVVKNRKYEVLINVYYLMQDGKGIRTQVKKKLSVGEASWAFDPEGNTDGRQPEKKKEKRKKKNVIKCLQK